MQGLLHAQRSRGTPSWLHAPDRRARLRQAGVRAFPASPPACVLAYLPYPADLPACLLVAAFEARLRIWSATAQPLRMHCKLLFCNVLLVVVYVACCCIFVSRDPATCSMDGSPSFSQLYCSSFTSQGKTLMATASAAISEFFFGPPSDEEPEPNGALLVESCEEGIGAAAVAAY